MERRQLLTVLAGAAAAWPSTVQAQQPERVRRIGILSGFAEEHPEGQSQRTALFQGLRDIGWIEGKNFRIEIFRWVTDDPQRMQASVREVVKVKPDIILGLSPNPSDLAFLLQETNTIPIVFVNTADPIRMGLVSSLSRPNSNITGFTNFEDAIGGKWMQMLKEAAPKMERAALLFNPDRGTQGFLYESSFRAAATKLGVEPYLMTWRDVSELERLLADHGKGNGIVVVNNTSNGLNHRTIFALASQHGLPAIYPYRWWAVAGGLFSYGPDMVDAHRRMAPYIDRILKGESAGSLPIQQPTKFDLVLNMKTAKALGVVFPPSLLSIADEIIE